MVLRIDVAALENRLQELGKTVPGVIASAVLSADGLVIASALPPDVSEEMIARLGVVFLSLSDRLTGEFALGKFRVGIVQGDAGYVVVTDAGPNAILLILTSSDVRLGLIMIEARRAAEELAELLGK